MDDGNFIWEVFETIGGGTIGFIKSKSYEQAHEIAFKRYKRPVDICYHDRYSFDLKNGN